MKFLNPFRTLRQRIPFDYYSAEVRENPYPFYQYLRKHAPVYYLRQDKCWMISRYEDVSRALKQPEIFSSTGNMPPQNKTLIGEDPPDHSDIRKTIIPGFTARRMAELEIFIREQTNLIIDQWADQEPVEFVSALTAPLPMKVVAQLLGIDIDNVEKYMVWSDAASGKIDDLSPQAVQSLIDEFQAFFESYIAQCQRTPNESIFNSILFDENKQIRMSVNDAVNLGKLFLIAGNETTNTLLALTMDILMDHPTELKLVQERLDLIPQVIEEVLRYESPGQYLKRRTTRAVTLHDKKISAGSDVFLLIASANRDENIFPDPDVFSVHRNPRKHIAFGAGPHYCIGLHLARLEARIIFEILFTRFKKFEKISSSSENYPNNTQIRGFNDLSFKAYR